MARSNTNIKPAAYSPEACVEARGLYRNIQLKIDYRPIDELKPAKRRARIHPKEQVIQVAESLAAFGVCGPIGVDDDDRIVSGHCVWEAAKLLGYKTVPVVALSHLSEAELRALALADNKLAELGRWDVEVLAEEFEFLTSLDVDFSPEVTGFSTAEIDIAIETAKAPPQPDPDDQIPEPASTTVSRVDDLWRLGDHRLLCADARDEASYRRLLGDRKARIVFVDLPYNVAVNGHVMGNGKIKHAEFVMASGEMSHAEFRAFLTDILMLLALHSEDGGLNYLCMDWRSIAELIEVGKTAYDALMNVCVWNKGNGGMGSLYRSKHELIAVFKAGKGSISNNVELGKWGRNRTNVWDYAGVNTFRRGRMDELSMHPTVKPVVLVADAIRDASRRGDIVLDVCAGSGTTHYRRGKNKPYRTRHGA